MYEEKRQIKFERYAIGSTALICAGALALLAILGPLGLDILKHKASQSAIYQIQGQDLVNLLLLAPLCLIGGILHFKRNENAKYFLVLVGIYIFLYTGLAYGIGQEWGMYEGNVEQYFWLFYILIIGGLVLIISSLSMFNETDAPEFNTKSLRIYIGLMVLFLAMFSMMWLQEILEVVTTGDTSTGSYSESPNVFWVIRYFDLGITLPLGFIGLYLLGTRPKKAYPLMLAFYGFFVTLSTAVVAMGAMMVLSNDPMVQTEGLFIFPILALLAWTGFFYLIKAKLPWFNKE
ncbi:MAG: hypothetical protein ACXACP_00820 [Candidatus Hodarchaeales archaeon]|jgi:hypothetical protein